MSITAIIIIVLTVGNVIAGIILLRQSATKFNLTKEQLKTIKERNEQLDREDKEEEKNNI